MVTYLQVASIFLLAYLAGKLAIILVSGRRHAPYPPGPKPKSLIGNMFDFPMSKAAQTYAEWGKKYNSDLVHAVVLGNHVVVVNTLTDADELFDRRAGKYSDRPVPAVVKLMGWDYNVGMIRYGDVWRFHRKICQQNFRRGAAESYHLVQVEKVHEMLQNLLDTPHKFDDHNKMLSISIPMAAMYGYDVKSFEDPCIVAANRSITLGVHLLLPGSSMINILPFLAHIPAWFPGASSHKVAAEVLKLTREMERIPTEFVKTRVEEGTAKPSLFSNFLEKKYTVGASKEEEDAIKNIASTVYAAASDTTISVTGTFFYVMALNPNIQRKAQAEIDRVIGSKRLPGLEDRDSLPYIEAIYREVMRFQPPVPLSIPHALSEDDYYKGYFIPKGTVRTFNRAMTHDEQMYPEPFKFKPERFFDQNGKLNHDDRVLAYGFGRRVCVGKYIASTTVWLTIASILACFDISKCKDDSGNDIEISDDYEDFGLLTHKTKFECSFVPRSSAAQQLIDNTR
ncbi:hypothetical protein GALMADRAFT_128336 [Galerina marginata CBS 339.88]|uniref:Cytochrome P450 n=1 Tax=Galerina marginata (strain CBS 339.88) TaxID=685588 RepID=A0A067SI95_GALM3|nr:hypothetical protein GALMADRAFT_128336 [Galerina marginata CBS 339.88]